MNHFEQRLCLAHEVYERCRIASIQQVPVETGAMPRSWLARTGSLTPIRARIARVFKRKAPYDFRGTLGPGAGPPDDPGRFTRISVVMEAKSNEKPKTSLAIVRDGLTGTGKKRTGSGLQEHQLKACAHESRHFGAIAAIVWLNGEQRGVLPPERVQAAWRRFWTRERLSIPWSQFIEYEVPTDGHTAGHEDWLWPLLEHLNSHPLDPPVARAEAPAQGGALR